MATPNGSLTPYAAASDLLDRYDLRTVADLINDVGRRTGGSPDPNRSTVEADPKLAVALLDGAGWIEAACLRSKRYSATDLHALTGASGSFLKKLNCQLAMAFLFERRPDKGSPPAFLTLAFQTLQAIANGERIFAFAEHEAAGNPIEYVMAAYDWDELALAPVQAQRYYGRTADLLNPRGSGWTSSLS